MKRILYFSWFLGAGAAAAAQVEARLASLPVAFETNAGQVSGASRFVAFGGSGVLCFERNAIVLRSDPGWDPREPPAEMRMQLRGGQLEALDPLPGKSNYFLRSGSYTNLPNYERIRYRQVARGIDLIVHGRGGRLEYDWTVAPGAYAGAIRFRITGADSVVIDAQGDLVARAGPMEVRHRKPVIYQEAMGRRTSAPGAFRLRGGNEVTFAVGAYDNSLALVIDPVLVFASRFGVTPPQLNRLPGAIAVDTAGQAYVVGGNFNDSIIGKLNTDGSAFLYATQISMDTYGVALDAAGDLYLTGFAFGLGIAPGLVFRPVNQLPQIPNPSGGAVLVKLDPTGSKMLLATTLSFGLFAASDERNWPTDAGRAVALDAAGNIYVGGETLTGVPTTAGAFQKTPGNSFTQSCPRYGDSSQPPCSDGFVMKLAPDGSLVYSTYLGGSGIDGVLGLAVDASGSAYVTGATQSPDFPATPGAFQPTFNGTRYSLFPTALYYEDAFVAKLNPQGSALVYSTFLASSRPDFGNGIVVDSAGNAWVVGTTTWNDFPVTANALQADDAAWCSGCSYGFDIPFVSRVSADGTALLYSSFFGGEGGGEGNGIALDSEGSVYLTGTSLSSDFPSLNAPKPTMQSGNCVINSTKPPVPPNVAACTNAFVAKLTPDGTTLVYSTFLGGTHMDTGQAIAVDPTGEAYVTGVASNDFPEVGTFPVTAGTAFFAKLGPQPNPPAGALPPEFSKDSITSAADFTSVGVTRGGLSTLFGTNLTMVTGTLAADGYPLPTQLAGTSVTVNGYPAPILSVASVNGMEQITFQTSYNLQFQDPATVVVTNNGVSTYAAEVRNNFTQERIFTVDGVYGAIEHGSDSSLVTQANPARAGEVVVIYGTGLGPVDPPVPEGQPAPASPLSSVNFAPSDLPPADFPLRMNGINAEILFEGLTPGAAGLYQINARVPDGIGSGDAGVDLGSSDSRVKMPVQ